MALQGGRECLGEVSNTKKYLSFYNQNCFLSVHTILQFTWWLFLMSVFGRKKKKLVYTPLHLHVVTCWFYHTINLQQVLQFLIQPASHQTYVNLPASLLSHFLLVRCQVPVPYQNDWPAIQKHFNRQILIHLSRAGHPVIPMLRNACLPVKVLLC